MKRAAAIFSSAPSVTLQPLRVRGQFLEQSNGTHWTGIGCSDFHLFGRFLNGEDITPILAQRSALGFNLLRVWTRYQLAQFGIGDCTLAMHPDLYESVVTFLSLCASYGCYVQFTAYVGADNDYDPQHWTRLGEALHGASNVILELVNENDVHAAKIDTNAFDRIPGVLCSRGSNGSANVGTILPPLPPWDYMDVHWNSASEWQRKISHGAMDVANKFGLPVLSSENPRYDDNESSLEHAEDAGAGVALLCAGAMFHSTNGKNSTLWTGSQLAAATAWANGAKRIDLDVQDVPYERLPPGDFLRVYRKGDQTVSIRK